MFRGRITSVSCAQIDARACPGLDPGMASEMQGTGCYFVTVPSLLVEVSRLGSRCLIFITILLGK